MIATFSLSRLPRIVFGAGSVARIPDIASQFGRRGLLVTGSRSFRGSARYAGLRSGLEAAGVFCDEIQVAGEPSPQLVDDVVARFYGRGVDVVVGIGGGSVLDAAKAVAGLLPHGNTVMDHLEGVGPENPYRGPSTPFVAVPTTAGTGSEATKNAVLSVQGTGGFKKSFRDERLVPEYAVVDPSLLATCPPSLIAANGMDAVTQLLESLVSTRANPMTDALAMSGLEAARDSLLDWYDRGGEAPAAHSRMAYAALLSGITLAQVGLGSVHGLAAPLGAYFPIPHGVACGTLVARATETNIRVLKERQPENPALVKYAQVGRLLSRKVGLSPEDALNALVEILEQWSSYMQLPRLAAFGITDSSLELLVGNSRGSSMKTNPVELTDAELTDLLRDRL